MVDYQRVVEDIQGLLYSLSPVDKAEMARLNEQYRAVCEAGNLRLRHCLQLLQRGLRSEALQQCEEEPNLLDLAAKLDFPELPQWNQLLAEYQLPGAPALMLDAAAELNEAYVAEQPLASLLRTHRLLALARAPLAARLQTLRLIARRDAANAVWQQDLREYEQARCSELEQEINHAARDGDFAKVRQIRDELGNVAWSSPPSATLFQRVEASYAELDRARAQQELAVLERKLNEAFAAMDLAAGREHKTRWDECLKTAAPGPEDEVLQRAAPALQWLREQEAEAQQYERYQQALRELDRTLAREKTAARIHLAYQKAAAFGFALPEAVLLAYESRLAGLEREKRRFTWLVILCIFAAVCVLSALALWQLTSRLRHARAKDWAVQLSDMLQQQQWDKAQKTLESVPPEMLDFSELSGVVQQVREGLSREQLRRQESAHRLQRAETLLDQLRAAGSLGSVNSKREELTKLIEETTMQLALSEQEKQRFFALAQTADSQRKTMQDSWNQNFTELVQKAEARLTTLEQELQAVSEQLALLDPAALGKAASLRTRLEEAGQEFASLAQARATVDPGRAQVILSQELRHEKLSETLAQRCAAFPFEERITAALADPERFHAELSKYRGQFPASPRVSQEVLAERDLWAGLAAWSDLARRWAAARRGELSPPAAAAWLEELRRWNEQYPGFCQRRELEPLMPYLEAIRNRNDDQGRWLPAFLKQRLETDVFFDNWTVVANTKVGSPAGSLPAEKKYYVLRAMTKPANVTTEVIVTYLSGLEGETKTVKLLGADIVRIEPSAHSLLLRQLTQALGGVQDENWASEFTGLFDLIRQAKEVDPVFQIGLLQRLMEAGCRGSVPLAAACAEDLASLKQAGWSELWMDPDDPDAAKARIRAYAQLRGLGKFDAAAAAARTREFFAFQARAFTPVGWLSLSPGDRWQCVSPPNAPAAGRLYVVYRGSGQSVELMSVGDEGRIRLPPGTAGGVPAGRPVYVEEPLPTVAK